VAAMKDLARRFGPRFTPGADLLRLAEAGALK
jgi:hypothetical protein